MKLKALIADDDMDVQHLMYDILEINFRDVVIERALSFQTFWSKVSAADAETPYHMIFLSVEYIKEEPENFLERLRAANPNAPDKLVLLGGAADVESLGEGIGRLPLLEKPFSLDKFEEVVKAARVR